MVLPVFLTEKNMSKISLKERAYKYLKTKQGTWVNGGELERLAMAAGYKGSTVSRELRLLAEESRTGPVEWGGYIHREEKKGKKVRSVWYRFMHEPQPEVMYKTNLEWFEDLPDTPDEN